MARASGFAAVCAVFALGLAAVAASADDEPVRRPVRGARSVGTPQDGHLVNGRRLRESETVAYLADAAPRNRHFGTEELVGVIERGARAVARAYPDSVLRVGDLSAKGGGEVHMHASHESGRDADVAFYLRTKNGEDARPARFVAMGADGRSADGALVFDAPRNWALVQALLSDRGATVTHIFVADVVKTLLIAQAHAVDAPARIIARAEALLSQPRGSFPHDNHFHVRVACAPDDKPECLEYAPRPPRASASPRGRRTARVGRPRR